MKFTEQENNFSLLHAKVAHTKFLEKHFTYLIRFTVSYERIWRTTTRDTFHQIKLLNLS